MCVETASIDQEATKADITVNSGIKDLTSILSCRMCDETFQSRGDLNFHMTSEQCL